jgi:hypothetical protein
MLACGNILVLLVAMHMVVMMVTAREASGTAAASNLVHVA